MNPAQDLPDNKKLPKNSQRAELRQSIGAGGRITAVGSSETTPVAQNQLIIM